MINDKKEKIDPRPGEDKDNKLQCNNITPVNNNSNSKRISNANDKINNVIVTNEKADTL